MYRFFLVAKPVKNYDSRPGHFLYWVGSMPPQEEKYDFTKLGGLKKMQKISLKIIQS